MEFEPSVRWRCLQQSSFFGLARAKFLRLQKSNTKSRENLKSSLGIFLIVGVIIGFVIGYGYPILTREQKSWHQVTSFVLATANGDPEHFKVANTYPDIHYSRERFPKLHSNGEFVEGNRGDFALLQYNC